MWINLCKSENCVGGLVKVCRSLSRDQQNVVRVCDLQVRVIRTASDEIGC